MEALFCGAAVRLITPPPALLKELRGLGGRRFSGQVVSDLHLRLLALQTGEKRAQNELP